jgi:UDP-N-acetylglucosamine 2-epimerase (non-hydrolysing)
MKIHVVFGTRPEAIKMAPIIQELRRQGISEVKICVTSQHRSMLEQALALFNLVPDIDLNIMKPNQNLSELTQNALSGLYDFFQEERPNLVLVQGDTTTTFVASLAAFYHKIAVGHVEAGIRSHHKYSPWPEETNRKLTSCVADLHFAPTPLAAQNLLNEGIDKNSIHITGNTIIDVLLEVKETIKKNPLSVQLKHKFSYLDPSKKLLLVTAHRRESFGTAFAEICKALATIAKSKDVQLIFPVHLNPNVQAPVHHYLKDFKNVFLIEPQDYFSLVYLLERCYLVLTDSGGIQEEAPSFNKPLLVMRNVTERVEGLDVGVAKLVGTEMKSIVEATRLLLENEAEYNKMTGIPNPYGDGKAAQRICEIIAKTDFS